MNQLTTFRKEKIKTSKAFKTYWKFCAERQNVYMKRVEGESLPWTEDLIIQNYKFTNVYRASDRVSQYLIKNVIYSDNFSGEDLLFRVLLFKIFNKIETWEYLEKKVGQITYTSFNFKKYNSILTEIYNSKDSLYSAAYIMPSGGKGLRCNYKHEMHLNLISRMMRDKLASKLENSKTMEEGFKLLIDYPTIGNFLAYQFITDINYSQLTNYSEMEFVIPGPGALDGIKKCFTSTGNYSPAQIIQYMCETATMQFENLGLDFKTLWGRPLQLIDCQNVFCEVDKYSRVAHPELSGKTGRIKIKQKFREHSKTFSPWFPPKWGINQNIKINRSH